MPDLDVLDSAVVPGWLAPYRLLSGIADPHEVGHSVLKSLCKSLRDHGGIPAIDRFQSIVGRVRDGQIAVLDALREVRSIERSVAGDRHGRIAARAAARLIVEIDQGASKTNDNASAFTDHFCWEVIDHHLFGRARPKLVGSRFTNRAEALAFELSCKDTLRPHVAKVAQALTEDPSAAKLRSPRMAGRTRDTTSEMLHKPIQL